MRDGTGLKRPVDASGPSRGACGPIGVHSGDSFRCLTTSVLPGWTWKTIFSFPFIYSCFILPFRESRELRGNSLLGGRVSQRDWGFFFFFFGDEPKICLCCLRILGGDPEFEEGEIDLK